jgi:formate dehydrogenase
VRSLARALAAEPHAAVYGRTGSCLGRFGTLVAFLIDALCAVTGNLDRPGGAVFGRPAVALDEVGERIGLATYGRVRSRIGGFPDVIGNLPATLLPREIETPGDRQVRALFLSAGNPMLSVPDGHALERALERLELCVSLDLYVNESNRHADYVLPATTWLEREDLPLAFLGFYTKPFVQWTEPVVEPAGESRQEWEVIEAAGGPPAGSARPARLAAPNRRPAAAHGSGGRPVRPAAQGTEHRQAAARAARGRDPCRDRHRRPARQAAPSGPSRAPGPAPDRGRAAPAGGDERRRSELPPASDRHARAALAQLLDAQRAAADARRAHARGARASR